MKKLFIIIALFVTSTSMMQAQPEPVILNPTNQGTGADHGQKPRTPITIPEAYIDGHTLTFESSCIGCTITLLNENDVIVYIDVVDENGEVEIPTTFMGTYELQLVKDDITFVGEIEL